MAQIAQTAGQIPRKQFDKTRAQISALGLWRAIDGRVNFFDNCWEYHRRKREDWIRDALKGKRRTPGEPETMHSNFVKELQASEGKVVRLTSTEGEVLSARVLHVSEEDEDVTIDILATNQPEHMKKWGKTIRTVPGRFP